MATQDTPDTLAPAAPEAPAKTPRRRASAKAAVATDTPAAEVVDALAAESPVKAPARRRRTKPAPAVTGQAVDSVAEVPAPVAEPAAEPSPAPKTRSRRRAATPADAPTAAPSDAAGEAAVDIGADVPSATAAEPAAPPPAAEPVEPPARAAITLRDGRAPVFVVGRDTAEDTLQGLVRWQDEDGALRLPDADALTRLLDELGVRVDVDEAVWALLARRGDLQQRIDHLSALYPQGLDAVDLPAATGLRACQREGAFYAACVGHCALADEPALAPEQQLALAWQLVQRHFGAQRLALRAPAGAVAGWAALLGTEPAADVSAADVLLIDARSGLPPLTPLPAATWLWLLASPALLEDPAAAAWLEALDRTATGAVATWQAQQDERALAPLLLHRRFADVAEQWPAWAPQTQPVTPSDNEAAQQAALLSAMREGLARWQRSGFLSDSEQLALLRQRRGLEQLARAAAAGALVPTVQRALAEGAQRVLVFTADADLTGPLAEVLQGEYLPAQALPAGEDTDHWLRAWRDAEGPRVLVLADEADPPRIATHPHRPAVVLLDGAADETLRIARLARVRWPRQLREAPVWQMAAPDTPALPPAPAQGLLRGAALADWLAGLQSVGLPAPSVAAEPQDA